MSIEWQGKSLYHYTDFFALQGIIENHEIWLNNIKCMNDTKEIWHLMNSSLNPPFEMGDQAKPKRCLEY